jgi:hypothetical protein
MTPLDSAPNAGVGPPSLGGQPVGTVTSRERRFSESD